MAIFGFLDFGSSWNFFKGKNGYRGLQKLEIASAHSFFALLNVILVNIPSGTTRHSGIIGVIRRLALFSHYAHQRLAVARPRCFYGKIRPATQTHASPVIWKFRWPDAVLKFLSVTKKLTLASIRIRFDLRFFDGLTLTAGRIFIITLEITPIMGTHRLILSWFRWLQRQKRISQFESTKLFIPNSCTTLIIQLQAASLFFRLNNFMATGPLVILRALSGFVIAKDAFPFFISLIINRLCTQL
jgi:hypothetical protein